MWATGGRWGLCGGSWLSMGRGGAERVYQPARAVVTGCQRLGGLAGVLSQLWRLQVWDLVCAEGHSLACRPPPSHHVLP